MTAKAQILALEDQQTTANLLVDALGDAGYEVSVAGTLAQAREKLAKALPDLLILDRTLPDGDGLAICQEVRAKQASAALPVLFLSARKSVEEKVTGLEGGADDYLAKPFSVEELLARVGALLRRSGATEKPKALKSGSLTLDIAARKTYLGKKDVALSAKEFDLLWFLMSEQGKVVQREVLLQKVWGYEEGLDLSTKVIDVTLSHIREKLGSVADRIVAVRGIGYRFDAEA
ncbi:MAG: response regulator transcription factor [Elusimicrobia bacterium]|nr:response regulator transcription factor [Elusimicrobiota bacterium]